MRRLRVSLLIFLSSALTLLSSCSQELYSKLEEREINEMVAALSRYNISSNKIALKEGYSLSVSTRHFADAINILSAAGYPQRQYVSLNDLFGKSGLIPTPFEEHVRYIYGLSEELARTVALFDGVIVARVHIALPTSSDSNSGKVSVFIKYDQQFDYDTLIPRIRKFVSDSVEKVDFDRVEVLALPGQKSADFYRIRRRLAEERKQVRLVEFFLGAVCALGVLVLILLGLYRRGYLNFSKRSAQGVISPIAGTATLSSRQAKDDKSKEI